MTYVQSLLVALSLTLSATGLRALTPTRIARGSQEETRAFAREVERTYNLQLAPSTANCTSPYDHFWFEVFEKLELDEFGLPVCTALQTGSSEGDLVMRYRFTPSPAIIALRHSLDRDVNRIALSPKEALRWAHLRSRVNWLAMVQTGWITLIAKERRIVSVDFTCPWESMTQKNEERAVIQRMREILLPLRSRPMPGGDQ
jgi:hypothetical protein